MRIVVLGSAAGGGFPQWNCNAPTSHGVRTGSLRAKKRTQASLAVSADGERWLLVNASPDFRQQVGDTPALWPRGGLRHSPIEAVILTSGEIDHVAGLLSMRESQPFALWAAPPVLAALAANPIFDALNPRHVERHGVTSADPFPIAGPGGALGLTVTAFPVPGKVPLYLEGQAGSNLAGAADETMGLEIACGPARFHYIPGCAAMTPALRARLRQSPLVFFDGTLWRDDELITTGVGTKTGQRMGHMSIDGPDGTVAAFADLGVRRKVLVHVNTTNPVLDEDSPERAALAASGWEVAEDGMEIAL
ncbi:MULTISPECIES: pyrroloquinoline quinone biosynthesis protein PqqB [unclassified Inquilinus]|jgi:pyrroloquinoline quinone biosynthesis protein B|uniref:pyrroloquinoline quinone biosynthesis protein PqqB n=1 Tax=unclassified Inquilinus TaxID=2645927 RepID=UPI003F90BE57